MRTRQACQLAASINSDVAPAVSGNRLLTIPCQLKYELVAWHEAAKKAGATSKNTSNAIYLSTISCRKLYGSRFVLG